MIHGWSSKPGNRGTSDHAPVTLALQIKNHTFTPGRLNRATNWAIFEKTLQALRLPEDAWPSPEGTLQAAAAIDNQFQLAIDAAVLWSKPSTKSRRWWSPEIKKLKTILNNAQREVRNLNTAEAKEERRKAATRWRSAVRQAQWKYWEETFHLSNRSTAGKVSN
ncbi:hypothetical protein Q9L58_010732, partial [Maublancomyces gigas]